MEEDPDLPSNYQVEFDPAEPFYQKQMDFTEYQNQQQECMKMRMDALGGDLTTMKSSPCYNNVPVNKPVRYSSNQPLSTPTYGRYEQKTSRITPLDTMPLPRFEYSIFPRVRRSQHTFDQRVILENRFDKSDSIEQIERIELGKRINLTEHQIKIWFQNRRARLRKYGRVTSVKSSKPPEPTAIVQNTMQSIVEHQKPSYHNIDATISYIAKTDNRINNSYIQVSNVRFVENVNNLPTNSYYS